MANVEEISNADINFRGNDGNECEAFVVAIRDLAFTKGKNKDYDWMLSYATTRLRGKALRWHAKLDVSVQESWHLFVQALFEEYPLAEERDGGGIATPVCPPPSNIALPGNDRNLTTIPIPQSPATETVPSRESQLSGPFSHGGELVSPHRVYDPSSTGYQMGRLQIVYEEGRPGAHYVWWGHEFSVSIKSKCVTGNIHEALIVGLIPSSEPHHIGCINCRQFSTSNLGAQLFHPDYSGHQAVSNIWSILADGTLNATLPDLVPKSENSDKFIPSKWYSTTAVYVDISGTMISFVKESGSPRMSNPISGLPAMRASVESEWPALVPVACRNAMSAVMSVDPDRKGADERPRLWMANTGDSIYSDTPNLNIIFDGSDGSDCEAFITAIREFAFVQRKEGDTYWMLQYATHRLRGKALRWHAEVDPPIRKEWDLFVRALFEAYPRSKSVKSMRSDPTDAEITFRGTDGNECEAFIATVRELAFFRRKEGDTYWMLQYATTRLRGQALRWHAELDPVVRKDWDLFVRALFREYPFVEEGGK